MQFSHLGIVNFSIDHMEKKFHLRIKGPIYSSNKIHNTNDEFNSSQYISGIFLVPGTFVSVLYTFIPSSNSKR